ncbi:MAG TPA: sulfotransferase domain-containing protein [Geminicoccaceae bacterium]|nr:sulfotransferase domain-containing protein [Geminicoccaceae bacterium]
MRHELVVGLGYGLRQGLFFLPRARRIGIERWLRGWEETRLLARADVAFVSYAKSGRTWLRTMLSRAYQLAYDIPEGTALEFDNLKRLDPRIPSVLFTHGNYLRDYLDQWTDRAAFRRKRVLLLVRDPRDTAVSQYFQWKHRMHPAKKALNAYPPHGSGHSVAEFVLQEPAGLAGVLDFLELWERELPQLDSVQVVRYEALRGQTAAVLSSILDFLGTPAPMGAVEGAVAFASVENMRRLEAAGADAGYKGQRLKPGDVANPESFKVRRGKVGGWRDYLSAAECDAVEAMVQARPGQLFGYKTNTIGDSSDTGAAISSG